MTRPSTIPLVLILLSAVCSAQNAERDDEQQDRVAVTVTPLSMQRNVPGRWATLAVNTANLTDTDVEETVARCEGFLAGTYKRGDEFWPVFNLFDFVESKMFLQAAAE